METKDHYQVIIIGAGPAGLTAALYLSRAKISTLIIDQSSAGGQVKTTHIVANYPGFIEPIEGHVLAQNMYKQAARYGTKFALASDITNLNIEGKEKWIEIDNEDRYTADFILITSGSSPRQLKLPGEKEFKGNGISYCATCDGEFYTDKDIFVIGGGNSAMEESLLLLKYVRSLTVIHQFDHLQAEKITAEKVLNNPKVKVLWEHEPRSFSLNGEKMAVEVENLKTHERETIERDGVFIFVGMIPNAEFLKNSATNLDFNTYGYITTNELMETNIPRVLAAGDIRDKKFRQITTSVGDGTIAALQVIALS
ncbi:MAG: NAD(P)/FAD-dependent oxidoreductase [Promethearchaeota archaeon]